MRELIGNRSYTYTLRLRRGIRVAIVLQLLLALTGGVLLVRSSHQGAEKLLQAERVLVSENLYQLYLRTLEGSVLLVESAAARIAPVSERFLSPDDGAWRIFQATARRLEFAHVVQFVNAQGQVVIDSRGRTHGGVSLAGTEPFEEVIRLGLGRMYMGSPQTTAGRPSFVVGTAVYATPRAPEDGPIGVMLAYVDPGVEYLSLERGQLTTLFHARLVDNRARVISAWPDSATAHATQYVPLADTEWAIVRDEPQITVHIAQHAPLQWHHWVTTRTDLLVMVLLLVLGTVVLELLLLRTLNSLSNAHVRTLRSKDSLLRELHHRVKNNLQVLVSLLHIELDRHTSVAQASGPAQHPNPEQHPLVRSMRAMQLRMQAMAEVHDAIYQSETLHEVDLHAFLCRQIAGIRSGIQTPVIVHDIPAPPQPLRVSIDAAVPLGLVVNELVTNAVHHAFSAEQPLRQAEVRLEIELRDQHLIVRITDNGVGFDPQTVEHGLGLVLVEALADQIGAEACCQALPNEGTRWEISLPDTHVTGGNRSAVVHRHRVT